ncbi:MAG: putative sugar nucleotidyl transferase, partial [Bacteroides sp.]
MRVFLHDAGMRNNLLPLTYFKSIGELRIGILTQQESWAKAIGDSVELYSENTTIAEGEEILVIYAGLIATPRVVAQVATLERGKRLSCDVTLAARFYNKGRTSLHWDNLTALKKQELVIGDDVRIVTHPWHIFQQAQAAIEVDFERITAGRTSAPLDPSVRIYGNHRIFLESGAQAIDCTLNTHSGSIYIGRGAEIMEGAAIRGTFALGEHSV